MMPHDEGDVSALGHHDEWLACEATIAAALQRLRELSSVQPLTAPAGPLGIVDVVQGSTGVWHAFWLHAGIGEGGEVCAIIPDLRPFTDVLSGTSSGDWDDLQHLLASGSMNFRVILPPEVTDSPMTSALVDHLVAGGFQVRLSPTPGWFFVSGDRVAATPLTWGETEGADVAVLRGGPVVGALNELFEHRWHQATTWAPADEVDAVLRLLANGRSDEEVAEELAISLRTVRRRVAEAMTRHGASTRFELGCRHAAQLPPN